MPAPEPLATRRAEYDLHYGLKWDDCCSENKETIAVPVTHIALCKDMLQELVPSFVYVCEVEVVEHNT